MATKLSKKFRVVIGRKGGKARARKYKRKQLSAWGRLGGRPEEYATGHRSKEIVLLVKLLKDRTQEQLAKEIGCSQPWLAQVLAGKNPGLKIMRYLEKHDAAIKPKAENKNRQQKPRGQNESAAATD